MSDQIDRTDTVNQLERKLVERASQKVDELLDLINQGDPGLPQTGESCYFSMKDSRNINSLKEPELQSSRNLANLCRAFDDVNFRLANRWFTIKRIGIAGSERTRPECFYFTSSDGARMDVSRFENDFAYLKFRLTKLRQKFSSSSQQ